MDDISLFLGFFSVIFAVFSCEMGVKIFYMPLFKPKKGGLELGRGTSKSNRIKRTFQGRHHVSDHTKGYAGDSAGIIVTYEDICTSKRKVTKNLDEVVRRSYISSHVKAS